MSGRFGQQNLNWRLIAFAVGVFTLVALPVVQADAYAVSEDPGITMPRSVVVHTSTPGRYVLHVDTSGSVECSACYGDDGPNVVHDVAQRFAVAETMWIFQATADATRDNPHSLVPIPASFAPESPPPRT